MVEALPETPRPFLRWVTVLLRQKKEWVNNYATTEQNKKKEDRKTTESGSRGAEGFLKGKGKIEVGRNETKTRF